MHVVENILCNRARIVVLTWCAAVLYDDTNLPRGSTDLIIREIEGRLAITLSAVSAPGPQAV